MRRARGEQNALLPEASRRTYARATAPRQGQPVVEARAARPEAEVAEGSDRSDRGAATGRNNPPNT